MSTIKLADIFQSNMVIQRDKPIRLWGSAPDATVITVTLGTYTATAAASNGTWNCVLSPLSADIEQSLRVYCNEDKHPCILLEHISIGDIWIAAGQSNMEYFLRYDAHWNDTKKLKKNPFIHMYNCPRIVFEGQERNTSDSGYWFEEHDSAWETFSAPGYSFARNIQPHLNVPIGIIGMNWGGSPACAWIDRSYLEKEPLSIFLEDYDKALENTSPEQIAEESKAGWLFHDSPAYEMEFRAVMYGLNEKDQKDWILRHQNDPIIPLGHYHYHRPSGLYEHMLLKLAPFSIKGVLWYQGESDTKHADLYDQTFTALIDCWRSKWQDNFPFLFVQIAPFEKWLECDGTNFSLVRKKQELVSKTVPDAYMTSIMDLGMYEDIHPKFKMEIGNRLALLARGKVYGEDLLCECPEFYCVVRKEDTITLSFLYTGKGLYLKGDCINDLKVMQNGTECIIKNYEILGHMITFTIDNAAHSPLEIQYAETSYAEVNLYNSAGLPMKPFTRFSN